MYIAISFETHVASQGIEELAVELGFPNASSFVDSPDISDDIFGKVCMQER